MQHQPLQYRMSSAWRVSQDGPRLLLHGGGDAAYEVMLASEEPSRFVQANGAFTRDELSDTDRDAFEQLVTAGVVEPVGRSKKTLKVAILGDSLPAVLPKRAVIVADDVNKADIVLIVRATSTHGELIGRTAYYELTQPHLYVDVAYHHTVSLGPLVYPGETACIGCLYGRLRERWGDEVPPVSPLVVADEHLVAALIESELRRFADGDLSLVGQIVAWDIAGRTATPQTLLRSSSCPRCGRYSGKGKVVLE